MYGRILLSVVLPFFLIAAGFEYALEVRQGSDFGSIASPDRHTAVPHLSPAVVTVPSGRGRVSAAKSRGADEPDVQPVLFDSSWANDYAPGGAMGTPVNAATYSVGRRETNGWSNPASFAKPADLIASENEINLLLANATDLRLFRGGLYLPAPPARPSVAAVPLKADEVNAVPEPVTGLLFAAGACALLRKREWRPVRPA